MLKKPEFVNIYKEITGFNKKDSEIAVDGFVKALETAFAEHGGVQFVGFGNFEVAERAARKGRNPQTGIEVEIPACKAPKFKPSPKLKELVK